MEQENKQNFEPAKSDLIKDMEEMFEWAQKKDKQFREDTKNYWPDISLWPEDLPEGVYQGSIGGVRGYYSTKFRDALKEAAKKEWEKQQKDGTTDTN